jgi:very-short-patch-repair endonuclease
MAATEAEPVLLTELVRDAVRAFSGAELRREHGPSALKRAVARGDLVRVLPDVYAPTSHAQSFHVRAQAAVRWSGGVVSGKAALFLWGLIDDPPDEIEVLIVGSKNLGPQHGVRIRRTVAELPTSVRGGIVVLSPAASLVLGYGRLPASMRSEVFYSAIRRKLVGMSQLEAVLKVAPRVSARKGLERSARAAAKGAQSYLEERALYRVFNTKEFAQFLRQHEVVIEGNQFFLDMFDPETKTCVELDGRKGHLNAFRQRNINRDCWVASIGILTLRFSFEDLMERPEWCRQMVREVLRIRERP